MGGGSKSRTKKKSKSKKKKLTSSERQSIYDQIYRQVLSDIQAKKVAEEEEARRLAEEALAQKKLQARKAKEAAEKTLALNSLWSLADAMRCRSYPNMTTKTLFLKLAKSTNTALDHEDDTLFRKLAKATNTALDHEDDTASPIQPVHMPTQYGKEVNYENDMKPLDPLDELNKSTQNVSLEDKAAVQEWGIGSAQLL